MTAEEYIQELEAGLEHILQDPKFNNHKNQLASWKLNAEFNRSYDESDLWNRALFLSNKGCQLLIQGGRERLAYAAVKESALIYENLYETSEQYDRDYALVLAAICFDLAGYQANAVCLIKKLPDYEVFQLIPGGWKKRDSDDPYSNIFHYSNFIFVRSD